MMTQVRLGIRVQRFEVIAAIVAAGVLAVSAIIVRMRLDAIAVPMSCWDAWFGNGGSVGAAIPATCEAVANQFLTINEGEAGKVMASMALLPLAVGLFLGVPLVAREIEGGTAPTVWTLAASRIRWFGGRLLPLVIVLVVSLGILAIASDVLWAGREPWGPALRFGDADLHGPVVLAKGLAAFGLAVLLGTALGRVFPAVILGAVLCLGLFIGGQMAQSAWLDAEAMNHVMPYDPNTQEADHIFPGGSYTQMVRATDGTLLFDWQALEGAPADVADPYAWLDEHYESVVVGVPGSMYPQWSAMESIGFGTIGIGALLLAFPIVQRRRPM